MRFAGNASVILFLTFFYGCNDDNVNKAIPYVENVELKTHLQGTWLSTVIDSSEFYYAASFHVITFSENNFTWKDSIVNIDSDPVYSTSQTITGIAEVSYTFRDGINQNEHPTSAYWFRFAEPTIDQIVWIDYGNEHNSTIADYRIEDGVFIKVSEWTSRLLGPYKIEQFYVLFNETMDTTQFCVPEIYIESYICFSFHKLI